MINMKINIRKILLIMLIFIFLFSSCDIGRDYYKYTPEHSIKKNKYDCWEHICQKTEYNDTKISTMIPFDELLISNELSNKYYLNILYKQTNKDSVIYLLVIHEGYDLIYANKSAISLYIKTESHNYEFTASKTNRDDETFIYQTFASFDFTVQEERIYYRITLQELANIINADKVSLKLIGENSSFEAEVSTDTRNYLKIFYEQILFEEKK
jgi:hypothetical protein